MLETNPNQALNFSVTDSTVYVNAGTTRIGNTVMSFRGGSLTFRDLTQFNNDSTGYQYSALVLYDYLSYPDMTRVTSTAVSAIESLTFPSFPYDGTNQFASVRPIGLFTFYSPDGTQISLINSEKVI